MSAQNPAEGERLAKMPERLSPLRVPEVKKAEGLLGPREQGLIKRIDQDGDPDKVLQDIAGGQEASQPPIAQAKAAKTPEAVTPASQGGQPERAYLGELRGQMARVKEGNLSPQELQSTVDEAVAAGVPRDQIKAEMDKQGLTSRFREQPQDQKASAEENDLNEPKLPSGKRAAFLREGVKLDEHGNWYLGIDFNSRMSRPGAINMPGPAEKIAAEIDRKGAAGQYIGINIPREVDNEAYWRAKETIGSEDPEDYLDIIGTRMGWIKDAQGGWTIPADQIEKLTPEQYKALILWGRQK